MARPFAHVVALDPPPRGRADPVLRAGPRAHLAWGPAEAEFALSVARSELDLRAALKETYRALRDLDPPASPDELERALRGSARYPRTPETCARIARILTELGLIELIEHPRGARVLEAVRTDLERSATFRACGERLRAIEHALGAELPQRRPARAA